MARLSSPLKRGSNFLRRNRKWPLPSHNSRWHQAFCQEKALQSLKDAAETAISDPLPTLVHSFTSHNCDPTPRAYDFILNSLCRARQYHRIPPVLDRLEKVESFDTPECIFRDLISYYGCAGRVGDAIDVFCRIPNFRCVPTVDSLNALLFVLCRSEGLARMVPEVLLKSREMGIRVDESSFRILVGALCRLKKVGCAIDMLRTLVGEGFGVDVKIYSRILSAFPEQGDAADSGILEIMEEMRKLGFCPGLLDYSNVIKFLVTKGKMKDASNMLNRMKDEGVIPDVTCYTMVLSGLVKEDHFEKAEELFDELLVLGLIPSLSTFNVYINGLCKQNDVEAAIRMASYMVELGCKPNEATYFVIFERLCKAGDLSRVKQLLKEIRLKGFQLDRKTYFILIDAFVSDSEMNGALDLLNEMLEKFPNTGCSTVDEIIGELCQSGLLAKAPALLSMISRFNFVGTNTIPWNHLMGSSGLVISFPEKYFDDLVSPSQVQQSTAR